jgi:hypothetical protein
MSHPDDMSPQEDLKIGCFIFVVLGITILIVGGITALAIYYGVTMI